MYNAHGRKRSKKRRNPLVMVALFLLIIGVGYLAYRLLAPTSVEQAINQLQFDNSVTEGEKQIIRDAMQAQDKAFEGTLTVSMQTTTTPDNSNAIVSAYAPITNAYAARQSVTNEELAQLTLAVPADTDDVVRTALATSLGIESKDITDIVGPVEKISATSIAFIPADQLTHQNKLLGFNGAYYLDSFQTGAVFRQAVFSGEDSAKLADLKLNGALPAKDSTLKVNLTGVTALTRVMQKKLASVKDPLYFSAKIGDFLADADITHVSNEVSFREGCAYSNVSFCSPPEFIETLKDSGVDLVELTGNHNNDNGSTYNTESINLYHSLGWNTVGGGLNTTEAAKPYAAEQKGNKVTFLAYNMADGMGSGAVATDERAGANFYTDEKAKADIKAAKQNSPFVIVNIQYAECQAYPSGYVEFPECDGPIGGQEEAFRQLVDWGADMIVGSSAHQPQTYELYEGKPIYYGLGNLYFEQTQWPGTERGIILTNYFVGGKLLQTKLTPTVYDKDLQTRVMDEPDAVEFLDRLGDARPRD